MAGTFTHWMVVEEAVKKLATKGRSIKIQSDQLMPFVKLGAVSPDLPYLADPIGDSMFKKHNWADRMHYENTGRFISIGIELLQPLKGNKSDFEKCAAWLCGYASHVVTDTVVHPVVNSIVGPYIFNSGAHRECEMTQDSLVFKEVMGTELVGSGYHYFLKKCSEFDENAPTAQEHFLDENIKELWKRVLIENHGKRGADAYHRDILPDEWFRSYLAGIGFTRTPNPVFRHLGSAAGVAYPRTEKISGEKMASYYTSVRMPENLPQSHFFDKVFFRAVEKTAFMWDEMMTDIEKGDSKRCLGKKGYIKNWNLDLGINVDDADLWSSTDPVA